MRPECAVVSAATLDEVRAAEDAQRGAITDYLAALSIRSFVWASNGLIHGLKRSWFRPPPLKPIEIRHIVAYGRGTLGDNAVAVPAIYALHAALPEARLSVVVNATGWGTGFAYELFAGLKYVHDLHVFESDPVIRRGTSLRWSPGTTRISECDLFVDFSSFGNTGWLGAVLREMLLARQLKAKWVLGFRVSSWNRKGRVLNRVKYQFMRNEPRRPMEVLSEGGIPLVDSASSIPFNQQAFDSLQLTLGRLGAKGANIVVVNPGAKFAVKCWPAGRFIEVIRDLPLGEKSRVALTGTAAETALCESVRRSVPERAINLAGQTSVWELIELLRGARLCITNDTGTMHLATLVECPVVALFTTRLSPGLWFPSGRNVKALFAFDAMSYSCNDEGDLPSRCLNRIQAGHVLHAAAEFLK